MKSVVNIQSLIRLDTQIMMERNKR